MGRYSQSQKTWPGILPKNEHESGYRSKQKVTRVDILHMYKLSCTQQTTHDTHTSHSRAHTPTHPHTIHIYRHRAKACRIGRFRTQGNSRCVRLCLGARDCFRSRVTLPPISTEPPSSMPIPVYHSSYLCP